jgi:serine/threonine-protein kinase
MLLADGKVKLLDFGLAAWSGRGTVEMTPAGPVGTPAYSSPEQIEGQPVDGRSDLYAVGVMVFEMVARRRPFQGDPTEILHGHVERAAPRLRSLAPGVPALLDEVVARALEKEPALRYRDAAEMAAALAATLAGGEMR